MQSSGSTVWAYTKSLQNGVVENQGKPQWAKGCYSLKKLIYSAKTIIICHVKMY